MLRGLLGGGLKEVRGRETRKRVDGQKVWDYSHTLPSAHRNMRLSVFRAKAFGQHEKLVAELRDARGIMKGRVFGVLFADKSMRPHAHLAEDLRGKGVGRCMYDALLAHAIRFERVERVTGEGTSEDAMRVHRAVARDGGFKLAEKRSRDGIGYNYTYFLKD